jgi:serine/threonine-protein kinase
LENIDPPSTFTPDLVREVDEIVLRGLACEPADRYATARDMALAIESAMPLAPASQVGRWVESLAGEALAERTRQIAEIEGAVASGRAGETVYETARFPLRRDSSAEVQAVPEDALVAEWALDDAPAAPATTPAETEASENVPPDAEAAQDLPSFVPVRTGWTARRALVIAVVTICVPAGLVGVPQVIVRMSYRAPAPSAAQAVSIASHAQAPAPATAPSCSVEMDRAQPPVEDALGAPLAPRPARGSANPPSLAPRTTGVHKPSRSFDKSEIL